MSGTCSAITVAHSLERQASTLHPANSTPQLAMTGIPKSGSAAAGSLTAAWIMPTSPSASILPLEAKRPCFHMCDKLGGYWTGLPVFPSLKALLLTE